MAAVPDAEAVHPMAQAELRQEPQQRSNATEPASPPLPQRHVAVTPGPKAQRFHDALESSLAHTLGKLAWDNFAACYPTIASRSPATLKAVQKQMVDRLGALCRKEFESVVAARNVVARLNELEGLVDDAERRRDEGGFVGENVGGDVPVPPHMLPAPEVLAAHLAPHLAQQQSQLNAKLQTTQAHNRKLFDEIQKQRQEMESLLKLLEKMFEDIDSTNEMLSDVAQDVAKETRAVEVEMTGSY